MNTYDVRLRCQYDRPVGQQGWDDITVAVEAEDARQAIALAQKLAPVADKDLRGLMGVSVHGLDMRPLIAQEDAA